MSAQTPGKRRATWRLGARERARMQLVVIGTVVLTLVLFLRPGFLRLIENREFQVCQGNLLKIAQALRTYSDDWDGGYPPAEHWADHALANMRGITGDTRQRDRFFHCPKDGSTGISYIYNDLFGGLSLTQTTEDKTVNENLERLGRPERAPIVVEVHGSPMNGHQPFANWDDVAAKLTRKHALDSPTGSFIRGNLMPSFKSEEELGGLAGRRF